ncbi:MAG: hypothetical protein KF788_08825 [Piscinibacter sp.]|nr:hypothetical protein [Piscinibacter sp.]
MSGTFDIPIAAVVVSAQQDLWEITGHAARPFVPIAFHLSQVSDFGDAQAEILPILVKSGQTTSGSGGSAITPTPTEPGGSAAGFVAEINNTTKASAGTIVSHGAYGFNVLTGLDVVFTQEQQKLMAAGRRFTIELAGTPNDAITVTGTLTVQEVGS